MDVHPHTVDHFQIHSNTSTLLLLDLFSIPHQLPHLFYLYTHAMDAHPHTMGHFQSDYSQSPGKLVQQKAYFAFNFSDIDQEYMARSLDGHGNPEEWLQLVDKGGVNTTWVLMLGTVHS